MLSQDFKSHPNFKWHGSDDKFALKEAANTSPKDRGDQIALEPQRIRTFRITYNSAPKEINLAGQQDKKLNVIKNKVKQVSTGPGQGPVMAAKPAVPPQ